MSIKLYGHDTSPYVRRIRVLLAEMGLPFERDADSWSVPTAEVLRLNPMLRVPVLADGDVLRPDGTPQYFLESKLIAAYLYERYSQVPPPPIEPGGLPLQASLFHPHHRYDDENALACIDAATDSAINVFLLELDGIGRDRSPYLKRQYERTRTCLSWLESRLAGRASFHEGVFSYLDIALTCSLDWMLFRERYPVFLHRGLERFLTQNALRPTLAATHPSRAASTAPPQTPR